MLYIQVNFFLLQSEISLHCQLLINYWKYIYKIYIRLKQKKIIAWMKFLYTFHISHTLLTRFIFVKFKSNKYEFSCETIWKSVWLKNVQSDKIYIFSVNTSISRITDKKKEIHSRPRYITDKHINVCACVRMIGIYFYVHDVQHMLKEKSNICSRRKSNSRPAASENVYLRPDFDIYFDKIRRESVRNENSQ